MPNKINFTKYQGTGNDFVMIPQKLAISISQIQWLCDRKYGIGSDGLIMLWKSENAHLDFEMMYYNADGSESFCGNGSRCAVMYAAHLGWIESECNFISNDGSHYAKIEHDLVHLKMGDVTQIEKRENDWFIHTGSPHYISVVDSVDQLDIIPAAQKIRYNPEFNQSGVNVNFIECGNEIKIRTYERGVEDETLSCGTGATAAAIANFLISGTNQKTAIYPLQTQGGLLKVSFEKVDNGFKNVYLIGPATHVFDGTATLRNF